MKLQRFLNEITIHTNKETQDIVFSIAKQIKNIKKAFTKKNVESLLNKNCNVLKIKFEFVDSKEVDIIDSAYALQNDVILIIFNKNKIDELINELNKIKVNIDMNNNQFLIELQNMVQHEVIHHKQYKKIPFMVQQKMKIPQPYDEDMVPYFSNPMEIEAYAFDIARELSKDGKSELLDIYQSWFPKNHIVMKKLHKKIYLYQEMMKKEK